MAQIFFKIVRKVILSIFLFGAVNASYAVTIDSTKVKPRLNVGFNFTTMSILPFLSVDYRVLPKIGVTMEANPRLGIEYPSIRGVNTNFIVHWRRPNAPTYHFIPAIELSFYKASGKDGRIKGESPNNPCEEGTPTTHIEFKTKARTSLSFLLSYGRPEFKFLLGLGIGKVHRFERG